MPLGLAVGILLVWPFSSFATGADFSPCEDAYFRDAQSWDAANCFYQVARPTGRVDEAKTLLEVLSRRDLTNPNLRLVQAYLEDNFERRVELYRQAFDLYSELDDLAGQLRTLDSKWNFLQREDHIEEALQQIDLMEHLVSGVEDPFLHARVALVRARHLLKIDKDFAGARNQLLEYEELLSEEGPSKKDHYRLRQRFFDVMGSSYYELGMPEKAFGYYSQEARLAESVGELRDLDSGLRNMQVALRDQFDEASDPDDRTRAIQMSREILDRARASDLVESTVMGLFTLGDLLRGEEAKGLYEDCVKISEDEFPTENRACRLRLATDLAVVHPDAAVESLERIRAAIPQSSDPLLATYDALNEIRVLWAARDYERAWMDSKEALETIENLRDLQERDFGRTRSFAAWALTYSWLTGRLLDLYQGRQLPVDLERAFEVGERMRARMLLDIFETMNASPPETPELQARRNELRDTVTERNQLQYDIRSGRKAASKPNQDRLEDLGEKERSLRGTISQLSGRFAELERPKFASLAAVREALLPYEALLTFQLAPEESAFESFAGGSWLTVITVDAVKVYRLGDGNRISDRARLLSDLLEQGRATGPLTVRLYQDLLAHGLSEIPSEVTDLILVPDKMLHRVPLAMLRAHEDAAPLGSRYRISRIPSATLWLHSWRRSGPPTPSLQPALVIAAPVSDGPPDSGRVSRITDFQAGAGSGHLRETYGELPFAEQEGWSIRRQLGLGTEILVGSAASERALKRMNRSMDLERFGILHFAAHAVSDDQSPERSGIVLTPDRPEADPEDEGVNDGILEFNEIVDLGFADRVVVLSTCHSARGEILRGEGVFDLARAFFQAGARAVVGSLWRLEDRATARFFDDFYRHLARGTSLSEALHLAQIDQIERGAPPSVWAGIVVIGDGSLVPFPDRNGRFHPGWVILAALVLLAVAVLVASRRSA